MSFPDMPFLNKAEKKIVLGCFSIMFICMIIAMFIYALSLPPKYSDEMDSYLTQARAYEMRGNLDRAKFFRNKAENLKPNCKIETDQKKSNKR